MTREIKRAEGKEEASLSRSRFKAQSGPQSAFRPLDCGPAGAICDLLSLEDIEPGTPIAVFGQFNGGGKTLVAQVIVILPPPPKK